MEFLNLVVDSREQDPFLFSSGVYAGVSVTQGTLQTGDYSVVGLENEVAVERKSLSDLVHCLGKDRPRFVRELQRARGLASFVVVVEADWGELARGQFRGALNPHSACQSVASFMARLGVPFWFCGSRLSAEYCAWSYLSQFVHGIRHKLKAVERAMNVPQPPKAMPRARVVRMAPPAGM